MKKIFTKLISTALAVGMIGSMAVTSAFAATTKTDEGIKNEYLEIIRRSYSGRFTIDTILDAKTGKTAYLLYHITSNLRYSVDDVEEDFYCNGKDGVFSGDSVKDVDDTSDDIKIERTLSFMPNKVNGKKNVVEVKYSVTNTSDKSHKVGGRIMLDTMLDSNDYAPFRIAGIGAVTTRMQFSGDKIPTMYQAFDSLEKPNVVSTGYFATGADRPDYVQFNNYWASMGEYEPVCDTSLDIGDSVVNSIWKPVELKPGQSKDYIAYYGLGELDVTKGDLTLGATRSASSFEINEEGNGYNPISLTAYLKNTSKNNLTNAEVTVQLPNGVTLGDEENSTVKYDKLASSGEKQNTWTLNALPSGTERTVKVKISAKADGVTNVKPIEYTFTIPAIDGAPIWDDEKPTDVATPDEKPIAVPDEKPIAAPDEKPIATPDEKPTQSSNNNNSVANVTTSNNKEATGKDAGKIATGDSTSLIALFASVLGAAGVAVVAYRKRFEK